MAAKKSWLLRVPEILDLLGQFPEPVLDRAAIENLFGVRRRRAHQLMSRFGGYQAGRTWLVRRDDVTRAIAGLGDEAGFERRRRVRLVDALDRARREFAGRHVTIVVDRRPERLAQLPDSIKIEPGRLTITFSTSQDLLARLYELSQAMLHDPLAFRAATERTVTEP
ncbi:MAG: hypothetical protein ACRD96_13395 [Bryobacteraceae bacterium]